MLESKLRTGTSELFPEVSWKSVYRHYRDLASLMMLTSGYSFNVVPRKSIGGSVGVAQKWL